MGNLKEAVVKTKGEIAVNHNKQVKGFIKKTV